MGQSSETPSLDRVNGIRFWKAANTLVLLTKAGVAFLPEAKIGSKAEACERFSTDAWAAECVFGFLAVAASTNGVLVFSRAKDGTFSEVSRLRTVEARDLKFDGKHLWIADGRGGVRCCSVDPRSGKIELVAIYPISGFSRGLAVHQDLIAVGAGDGGLVLLAKKD